MFTYDYKHELERALEVTEVLKGLGSNIRAASKAAGRLIQRRKKE